MKKNKVVNCIILFLSGISFIIFLSQCAESKKIATINFAYQYAVVNAERAVETRLFHASKAYSELYFKIPANTLVFGEPEEDKAPIARLLVRYKIFKTHDSNKFIDSSSVFLTFSYEQMNEPITGVINIKTEIANKGVLELYFIDLNQGQVYKTAIPFQKNKPEFPHHHYLLKTLTDEIIYNNTLNVLRPVIIEYADTKISKLYVREIPDSLDNLPAPPFQESALNLKLPKAIDSLIIQNGDTLLPKNRGVIHIRSEGWKEEGIAILVSDAPYPEIGFTPQLVAPVRYLLTEKEYKNIIEADETKMALDAFWLNAGGNKEKARELLRVYYNRVQNANKLFAGCRQGWQSDRGMIYVIFGSPTNVYINGNDESWTYTDNSFYSPLSFDFKRIQHPFCENEYELYRSQSYRTIWYANIEAWRKGRVNTQKE